jgi:transcriptional regulator with XRE-family HTH domain
MDGMEGNSIDVQVGARIKIRREKLGIDVEALASSVGVPELDVARFEGGSVRVPAPVLQAISEFLGVPPGLFFRDHEPSRVTGKLFELAEARRS